MSDASLIGLFRPKWQNMLGMYNIRNIREIMINLPCLTSYGGQDTRQEFLIDGAILSYRDWLCPRLSMKATEIHYTLQTPSDTLRRSERSLKQRYIDKPERQTRVCEYHISRTLLSFSTHCQILCDQKACFFRLWKDYVLQQCFNCRTSKEN